MKKDDPALGKKPALMRKKERCEESTDDGEVCVRICVYVAGGTVVGIV